MFPVISHSHEKPAQHSPLRKCLQPFSAAHGSRLCISHSPWRGVPDSAVFSCTTNIGLSLPSPIVLKEGGNQLVEATCCGLFCGSERCSYRRLRVGFGEIEGSLPLIQRATVDCLAAGRASVPAIQNAHPIWHAGGPFYIAPPQIPHDLPMGTFEAPHFCPQMQCPYGPHILNGIW